MRIDHRMDCCARCSLLLVAGVLFLVTESAAAQTEKTWAQSAAVNHATDVAAKPDAPATSDKAEFDLLKAQLAAQQDQIDQLRKLLEGGCSGACSIPTSFAARGTWHRANRPVRT